MIEPAGRDKSEHRELEQHYHRLMELPCESRADSIRILRADRPTLAGKLESLIDVARDGGDDDDPWLGVGQRVRGIVEEAEAGASEEESPEAEGRFGQYRILRVLGRGGMGTVYEAEQTSPSRRVALKVLPAALVSESTLRRFEHETEALARLQHPGVAAIYEAGIRKIDETLAPTCLRPRSDARERGQPYFAMELIEGRALGEFAASVALEGRLKAFARVCEAVHYAHTQGVIHRDLKPANIMVDRRGRPRVVDFGVARIIDDGLTTIETNFGQLIGTLAYMSPEQALGDTREVDTRSDVFALGVILAELVAGRSPREMDQRSLPEVVRIVREEDIPRLGLLASAFAGSDLEVVVQKATERDRNLRYQSAIELGRDVLRVLRDQPIEARSRSALQQLSRFAERHRLLVVGILTTLFGIALGLAGVVIAGTSVGTSINGVAIGSVLGAVGLGIGSVAARRALVDLARQRDLAQSATAAAQLEADRAGSMKELLASLFLEASPANARGREVTVREAVDNVACSLEDRFGESTDALGWANDLVGTCYLALGETSRAELHLRGALRMRRSVLGVAHENTLSTTIHLVNLLCDAGRSQEAVTLARSAVEGYSSQDGAGVESLKSIEAIRLLSRALTLQGEIVEAHCILEAAAETAEMIDVDSPSMIALCADLGSLELRRGEFERAEELLVGALRRCEEKLGEDHPQSLGVRTLLAEVLQARGRFNEASELLNKGLRLQERVLGREHPETLATLETLAEIYRKSERTYLASFLLERLVEVNTRLLGRNNPKTLRNCLQLGAALLHQGKAAAAVSHCLRALRSAEALYPDGSTEEVVAASNLGFASERLERPEEAVRWFERALGVASDVLLPDDRRLPIIRANYAVSLVGVGDSERSECLLAECYEEINANDDGTIVPQMFRRPVGDLREFFEAWGLSFFEPKSL